MIKEIKHWYKWHIHSPIRHFLGMKAKTDWIDAYSFMAKKMLPYLYDFRDNKKLGTPYFEDLDVHPFEKRTDEEQKSIDEIRTERWDYIINEIIFALEYCVNEDDSDCQVVNPLYNPNQDKVFKDTPIRENGTSELLPNEDYGATKTDMTLLKDKMNRVREGLRLMGQYFMNLWD